jgi:hypothetical protein
MFPSKSEVDSSDSFTLFSLALFGCCCIICTGSTTEHDLVEDAQPIFARFFGGVSGVVSYYDVFSFRRGCALSEMKF